MNYEETKKAYDEILELVFRFKGATAFNYEDLKHKAKCHLFGIELQEKYGLNLNPEDIKSLDWIDWEYIAIGRYGEKHQRTISCSDNGEKPEDEVLLQIYFPTGPYIFGDYYRKDYPVQFFQEFFEELKTYKPKYLDTANSSLYFSLENAGAIFNEFQGIFKKYHEKNREESKERNIKRLKEQLAKLEQTENKELLE